MDSHVDGNTVGYHLFFEPTGELKEMLSALIKELCGKSGGPTFIPHVTLLAEIPSDKEHILIEKTKTLAHSITPFSIRLGGVGMEEKYFKALFMKINNAELENAHEVASEIFSMSTESIYRPHLSLLYGNYSEEKKSDSISSLTLPIGKSFFVDRVHLYKTEGVVNQWRHIGEYALGSS